MTEEEWLSAVSAQPLLGHLRGELLMPRPPVPAEGPPQRCSRRKVVLFALAVYERVQHPPANAPTRRGIEALTHFAEARLSLEDLATALSAIRDGLEGGEVGGQYCPFYELPADEPHHVFWAVRKSAIVQAWHHSREAILRDDPGAYDRCGANWKTNGLDLPEWRAAHEQEELIQALLLRDIVGNPFRPVAFAPEWRTDTAATLARQMYESRDFSAMPILADALQDAGCDSDDVLSHCRSGGTHVRGCWVCDLVLGKE